MCLSLYVVFDFFDFRAGQLGWLGWLAGLPGPENATINKGGLHKSEIILAKCEFLVNYAISFRFLRFGS